MSKDYNHYVSKKSITRAIVDGVSTTALCGETFIPESHGKQSQTDSGADNKTLEICPECELFYGALRSEQEERIKETA